MTTIKSFLDSNRTLNKSFLEEQLGVSRATLNRHCGKESKMMQLALAELHRQQADKNEILLDVTAHQDSSGNTYFSGYCYVGDDIYKIDYTYGYGNYCEEYAVNCLFDLGLLPVKDRAELRRHYNIKVTSTIIDVNRKKDMYHFDGMKQREVVGTFR